LSILCSACTTKTVTKIKLIDIPAKYLAGCENPNFETSKQAIDAAKSGDYKQFSIDQAVHSQKQEKEINKCNQNILDLKKYQKRLKADGSR
jgi:hypothetical protein